MVQTVSPRANGHGAELLQVDELVKYFPISAGLFNRTVGYVRAVDGVSFGIKRGEAFGLVGESGCGKTTLAQTAIRLYKPTTGRILFDGQDIARLGTDQLRPFRRRIQMIFQDPYASLDPRMTVGAIVGEPLEIFGVGTHAQRQALVRELLRTVGLNAYMIDRYPHEFSGGQRQRIGIARALALRPELIICDEPVSALDVSIQAQVLNLLRDLQSQFGLTYLFIAHNLAVVAYVCNPRHPYTQALLSAVPVAAPGLKRRRRGWGDEAGVQAATHGRIVLKGDVPSPVNPPSGCRFRTRCPIARDDCALDLPPLREIERGHWVACFYAEQTG
jgi:oligopeptide/dipeptide ABC transporter ATP-binding protein